jgi:alpha-L-rhamnosidase
MRLAWDIEIPANTSAIVTTPNGSRTYGSGKWHIEEDLPHKELSNRDLHVNGYAAGNLKVMSNEFLYEKADFPSCHAASIAECANGDLLATYFGGSYEGCPDMCIWTQRKKLIRRGRKGQPNTYQEGWSDPVLVADGSLLPESGKGWREWAATKQNASIGRFMKTPDAKTDTLRKACYNPVLFQVPGGDLLLFYKLGKDVRDWTGYLMYSHDNGYTWTTERDSLRSAGNEFAHIPGICTERDSLLGAIKNQPVMLPKGFRCKDGSVLTEDRIL